MTIGVKILSAEGYLQLSSEGSIPQFIGRFPAYKNGEDTQEGAEGGLITQSYVAFNVDTGYRDVAIYWYIPENCWAYSQSTFFPAAASGSAIGLYLFVPPGTVISDVPVAYVFALNGIQRSSGPAMRIWKNNQLTFDSGLLHLSVEQIYTNLQYQIDTDNVSYQPMPWQPAYLIPEAYRDKETYEGDLSDSAGTSVFTEWLGVIKRNGDQLTSRLLKVYYSTEYPTIGGGRAAYTEDVTYGNTTNLVVPVINAQLYT